MSVTWDDYLQAEDLHSVSLAAQRLRDLAVLEDDQCYGADLLVAASLYLVRGEMEYGSKEAAWGLLEELRAQEGLLLSCTPAWRSRVCQWQGNTLMAYGDYAAAALAFERAGENREWGYRGSYMAPCLFNDASHAAMQAGANEWAYELALRSLNHFEQYPMVLDMDGGPEARQVAVLRLSQAMGMEAQPPKRRGWFKRR